MRRALRPTGRAIASLPRCFATAAGQVTDESTEIPNHASLYVHWPYCLRRCSYCNFNKYIPRGNNDQTMTECLQTETETLLRVSQVSRITSVFFGGGTPSLAPASTVSAILDTISKHASLPSDAEVTLEVNPTPAGRSKLNDFCKAGVNRFSIGVQSLQDQDLTNLGRDHNSHEALQTLQEARKLCPGKVSVDVMFGRPGQSVKCWESELSELLRVCDDHVSLYQLTLERGTRLFKQVEKGEMTAPSDEVTADMYHVARETLQQHQFWQYEVSNFTRHNAVSHHNVNYWKGGQYIGVGPGAHGRFVPRGDDGSTREARTQTLEPEVWIHEVRQRGHATRRRIKLNHLEVLQEVLLMGLRMTDGISHQHWDQFKPESNLHEVFGSSTDVKDLIQSGLLLLDQRGLRCSWDGLAVLDSLLPSLMLTLEQRFLQNRQSELQKPSYNTISQIKT